MTQLKNHQYNQFVYNIYFGENFTALYVFSGWFDFEKHSQKFCASF